MHRFIYLVKGTILRGIEVEWKSRGNFSDLRPVVSCYCLVVEILAKLTFLEKIVGLFLSNLGILKEIRMKFWTRRFAGLARLLRITVLEGEMGLKC